MQKEIETRFLEIDKAELIKKLLALGAVDDGEEKLEEIIFYAADGSWEGKNKFVRLRRTKGKVMLTYKINIEQQVDSAREIELEVSDLDQCSELLQQIGLQTKRQLEKFRHIFKLGDTSIHIDSWPKIPVYVEVEGPSVTSLEDACKQLDLDWSKKFDGDAREVFKKYGYDLDNISVITFSEFKQI